MAAISISDPYEVPSGKVARGVARVPPSKSIAHRALILAALAHGASRVAPIPDSDDVAATLDCLRALGVEIGTAGEGAEVIGSGGRLRPPSVPLDCRASGTTLRLLMAVCGGQAGTFTLDGDPQLRRRPVADLEEPLGRMGAEVRYADREGHPPVVVEGRPWPGGALRVAGRTSSQFLSGLLIASPLSASDLVLEAEGLVSRSYVEMTAALMARFGAHVGQPEPGRWSVEPSAYRGTPCSVEPDASAAAFLWAAGAVTGGSVRVEGLPGESLQGDARFPDLVASMGCEVSRDAGGTEVGGRPIRGLNADVASTPDLVPALVAAALFAPAPTTLTGVRHLRFKESDRLAVLAGAVTAVGGSMVAEDDRLTVVPGETYREALLDPQGDHRMAMAFAVMGLRIPGVLIKTPHCVAKSFPEFFSALEGLLS